MSKLTFEPQFAPVQETLAVDGDPVVIDLARVRIFDISPLDGAVAVEGIDYNGEKHNTVQLPISRSKREWKELTLTGRGSVAFKGIVR